MAGVSDGGAQVFRPGDVVELYATRDDVLMWNGFVAEVVDGGRDDGGVLLNPLAERPDGLGGSFWWPVGHTGVGLQHVEPVDLTDLEAVRAWLG